ncbi:MAG: DMT family transporter [Pseudomonadales bacterium]|nr:DMT family transporter [Pseudomonadales bacterium]
MAALNGSLGTKLNSPASATTILFVVGGLVSTIYLLLSKGIPSMPIQKTIPIVFYCGGVFVIFYILSITWVAPKFGVGNAISFVLLGQLISMAVIDQFGLLGALRYSLSIQRLCGIGLMIVGVFLSVRGF